MLHRLQRLMTTAIPIPSSSPPQCFADSPTPVVTSSPGLPSPYSLLHPNGNRSKNSSSKVSTLKKADRDGFTSPKKSFLGAKNGAENIPVGLGKDRKKHLDNNNGNVRDPLSNTSDPKNTKHAPRTKVRKAATDMPRPTEQPTFEETTRSPDVAPTTQGELEQSEPQAIENIMTIPRRQDWTPTKDVVRSYSPDLDSVTKISFKEITSGFNFVDDTEKKAEQTSFGACKAGSTKRIKLDLYAASLAKAASFERSTASAGSSNRASRKRGKSPRKPTTITARATSDSLPMEPEGLMQYFSINGQNDETSQKPRRSAKKSSKTKTPKKRKLPCRALASPSSAIQSLQQQDQIFGSASQLEREESPTFIRDTLQAIRESEAASFHTPPVTDLSTDCLASNFTARPTTRLSSLRQSRNLWGAACRNENGTLLQLDAIDLLDTPDVQRALACPDIQPLQEGNSNFAQDESLSERTTNLRGGWLDLAADFDVATPIPKRPPSAQQSRALHTKAPIHELTEPARLSKLSEPAEPVEPALNPTEKPTTKGPPLNRPSFAGLTDNQLSLKLASYGFKRIKKRDKMIQTLERCWDDQQKVATAASTTTEQEEPQPPAVPTHAKGLDVIHGLAERPLPKATKKKGRPKKTNVVETPTPPKKATKSMAKVGQRVPVKKSKVPVEDVESETHPPAVAVAAAVARKKIEIEDSATEDAESSTPKPSVQVLTARNPQPLNHPLPPSKSINHLLPRSSSTITSTSMPKHQRQLPPSSQPQPSSSSPSSSPLPPISDSITRAILHPSTPPPPLLSSSLRSQPCSHPHPQRNSITHPTFHEKMLMYDPIVIEDLTLWLNVEGLGAVGEDREVGALEVREWCERRGVCCLWGWGGGGRGWRR